MSKNVLIIGSGARESAIARSLRMSGFASSIGIAPGNGDSCSLLSATPPKSVVDYLHLAKNVGADLTIVGPEAPLAQGVVDLFVTNGLDIIGPNMEAAQLESSKIFAKRFMARNGVPTASFRSFAAADAALDFVGRQPADAGLVVKADGLCAGKGVIVAANREEAVAAVKEIAAKYGELMIVEGKLEGAECSYIVFVRQDGNAIAMPTSADHKRLKAGNQGPMTGGMGCFAPHPAVTEELERKVIETVVVPTLHGLTKEKIPYAGFLYFGLMLTEDGPKVLEYNVRLGDPEASVILPLLGGDFWDRMMKNGWTGLDIMTFVSRYKQGVGGMVHESAAFQVSGKVAVSVVLASERYPTAKDPSVPISGIAEAEATGAVVLHAGTKRDGDRIMTSGGRVLVVVGTGDTYAAARELAYRGVSKIHFDGMQFRDDIGVGLV